jgi:hypothetical protein
MMAVLIVRGRTNWFGTVGKTRTSHQAFTTARRTTGSRFPNRSLVQTPRLMGVHHITALNRSTFTPQLALTRSPNSIYPPARLTITHPGLYDSPNMTTYPSSNRSQSHLINPKPAHQARKPGVHDHRAAHLSFTANRSHPGRSPTAAARISERRTARMTTTSSTQPSPQ